MIYENKNGVLIRDLQPQDARRLTDEEIAQGWDADIEKYEMRLMHQAEGKSISLAAEYNRLSRLRMGRFCKSRVC